MFMICACLASGDDLQRTHLMSADSYTSIVAAVVVGAVAVAVAVVHKLSTVL